MQWSKIRGKRGKRQKLGKRGKIYKKGKLRTSVKAGEQRDSVKKKIIHHQILVKREKNQYPR